MSYPARNGSTKRWRRDRSYAVAIHQHVQLAARGIQPGDAARQSADRLCDHDGPRLRRSLCRVVLGLIVAHDHFARVAATLQCGEASRTQPPDSRRLIAAGITTDTSADCLPPHAAPIHAAALASLSAAVMRARGFALFHHRSMMALAQIAMSERYMVAGTIARQHTRQRRVEEPGEIGRSLQVGCSDCGGVSQQDRPDGCQRQAPPVHHPALHKRPSAAVHGIHELTPHGIEEERYPDEYSAGWVFSADDSTPE